MGTAQKGQRQLGSEVGGSGERGSDAEKGKPYPGREQVVMDKPEKWVLPNIGSDCELGL